ncbi:membrane protease YdiL (CAAX protease family) [Pelomonas saccharophila]|uniref:Membrane protease YdiL (CAAX protease family) n=1 Tax=Roseateles saccharophilus TaxID=304 RepID=A0ABU1YIM5_ROSSA|nr:CPBP family intramembrane glutamic endopeptidase [Roseateles saccharophilus]MDR7268707.1 membrane protease YdiL (CAAX protease family) [Roseateles saccharophilus]
MNKLLRNDQGQLRSGWWILLFAAVFLVSQWLYRPVSQGLQQLGVTKSWLLPLPVVFLLAVTWVCMRLRRQRLAAVGLALDAGWWRQLLGGISFGVAQMLAVAALMLLAGGVRFELDPARGWAALGYGIWCFTWVATLEELLFRGFVFQRLVDGLGAPAALLLAGALFAAAHLGNPGMDGSSLLLATLDNGLGAILLGLAWLRTGSLALPIGIHFGWNWMQGGVLGFDVSGLAQAGWWQPHLLDVPPWLSGGAFGPEASVLAVVADAAAVLLLWRWKGMAGKARSDGRAVADDMPQHPLLQLGKPRRRA